MVFVYPTNDEEKKSTISQAYLNVKCQGQALSFQEYWPEFIHTALITHCAHSVTISKVAGIIVITFIVIWNTSKR